MKNPKFSHAFEVASDLPPSLAPLKSLARNFRWSWHHPTRELFRSMDIEGWSAAEQNPILFLNGLTPEKLEKFATDRVFLDRLNRCVEELDEYLADETWFGKSYPEEKDKTFAYFCFEFGITEGLPIYSGGLGILAGDHLKAASDLGIPLVAVGLLYNRGYFRQRLSHDGWQQEIYPQYDFYQMPLTLMRGADDSPIRIEVEFPDRVVTCQIWRADIGRIPLYLLDSSLLENQPSDQSITDSLYSGDEEMRIRQEMILGIGGLRALSALGIKPDVCHMNEGHAAFLSVERIAQFMRDHRCDFRTARQVVASGNVFTTHTPVPAGFDLFRPDLLERYMGKTFSATGLPFGDLLRLGRTDPENQGEPFNMALLAMETANRVNGVAKLHADVTREMFSFRWPQYPQSEVPVDAITNGIHTMTWVSRRMTALFDAYLGTDWRRHPQLPEVWEGVDSIPDEELWQVLEGQRADLVRFVRRRLEKGVERRPDIDKVAGILDPRVLTIGFARRFATYKRASLMLTDRERLKQVLFNPDRPVQIVISGKSHPRDDGGKHIIQDMVKFIDQEGARARMVFLEDYDMRVARRLVQGVDVWLNNPRRPHEASGTSGMKVVPNGGLNCSILDGWWDEAYQPEVGWAIGNRNQSGEEGHQDWLDSRALYQLLEREIAPMFYRRSDEGIPTEWLSMVKQSIKSLAPEFSTGRMVRDYAEKFYVPAARDYARRSSSDLSLAKAALAWRERIQTNWAAVQVVGTRDTAGTASVLGRTFELEARVTLGALSHEDVRVQAVVGKAGANRELLNTRVEDLVHVGQEGDISIFKGTVTCDTPGHQGYTVRVIPHHVDMSIPSEMGLVAWE